MANTLAATFNDRDSARDAIKQLHEQGFHKAWVGLTKPMDGEGGGDRYTGATTATAADETMVQPENWLARMFGESEQSLHDALVKHGVRESDLRSLRALVPGTAILTIDGSNHPELAAQVISECGGTLITSGATSTGYAFDDAGLDGEFGDTHLDYSEYSRYRGGESIDDTRRRQLRDERGSVSIPVVSEEFILERAATGLEQSQNAAPQGNKLTSDR